jgi:hypothetical protein
MFMTDNTRRINITIMYKYINNLNYKSVKLKVETPHVKSNEPLIPKSNIC